MRCAICDYFEGIDSGYAYTGASTSNKVRWRKRFSEYQCDDCHKEVEDYNYDLRDTEENHNTNAFIFREEVIKLKDHQESPAVPEPEMSQQ